eukprot:c16329_g1_i1.p1 GENE.c16329_g1_i1~~c16329_g1_i1.p1  ORF type:complete len:296 (+),score=57.22 c16329_g1_i1:36-923(+)
MQQPRQQRAQTELINWLECEDGQQEASPKKRGLFTPRATPRPRGSFWQKTNTTTAYQGLQTKVGIEDLLKWFQMNQDSTAGLSEAVFVKVMTNITHLPMFTLVELFDLLDVQNIGSIGFDEFHFSMSMFCALESLEFTHFIFAHGQTVFSILRPGPNGHVSSEKMKSFLAILSVPEGVIQEYQKKLHVLHAETIPNDTLQLLLSCVADDWDTRETGKNRINKKKKNKTKSKSKSTTSRSPRRDSLASQAAEEGDMLDDLDEEEDELPRETGASSSMPTSRVPQQQFSEQGQCVIS